MDPHRYTPILKLVSSLQEKGSLSQDSQDLLKAIRTAPQTKYNVMTHPGRLIGGQGRLVFLSLEVSAYEKSLEDLKGELRMAGDLVRSLEQQRLPPRPVREAIRGFAADIEGGNDFIREICHNNTSPPIMTPGRDLTFCAR